MQRYSRFKPVFPYLTVSSSLVNPCQSFNKELVHRRPTCPALPTSLDRQATPGFASIQSF